MRRLGGPIPGTAAIACAALLSMLSREGLAARTGTALPPPGEVTAELSTAAGTGHRYAVYLPSEWTPDARWPTLVVLDPRGRAVSAAEIFRAGAERYGWVLLSSYDSRSDLPGNQDPNSPALEALLDEASRYAADPRRLYLAGFSGTSKFAWGAGHSMRGAIAGIIGCGGALPGPWETWKDVDFAYFGVAGSADFNHRSMRELDGWLDGTGVTHRFEYFPGGHRWLDPELAEEAIGWMELQAMSRGWRDKDVVVIERLYERRLESARALEEAGAWFAAWRAWDSIVADFEALRPVTRPGNELARLEEDPRVLAERDELTRALASENEYRERLGTAMRNVAYHSNPRTFKELLEELEIEALQAAAPGGSFTAQAARRKLELVYVQAAFYVPRVLFASGAPRRAALALQIATAVKPEEPETWYQLARAHAQGGESQKALAALERAVEAGFSDGARMRAEAEFAGLRENKAFRRLVGRVE